MSDLAPASETVLGPNFPEPFVLSSDLEADRLRFFTLAEPRVLVLDSQTYSNWLWKNFQLMGMYTARFRVEYNSDRSAVVGLNAGVNKWYFQDGNEDLIPFVVGHEVFESWVKVQRELQKDVLSRDTLWDNDHISARIYEFFLAIKEGKEQKLLDFLIGLNPSLKNECEGALAVAREKFLQNPTAKFPI